MKDSFQIAQILQNGSKLTKSQEISEKSIISRRETRKDPFLVPRFSAEKFATLSKYYHSYYVLCELCT